MAMPAAARERMSRVDTAWLRMDNDVNLMMIVGVWRIQPGIAYEALCERVQSKLLKYRRFEQKVVEDAMGAQWVTDKAFDIQHHVRKETLTRRRGESVPQSQTAAIAAYHSITARQSLCPCGRSATRSSRRQQGPESSSLMTV